MSGETGIWLKDARLLFDAFVASPWKALEVAAGPLSLSVSRLGPAGRVPGSSAATPGAPSDLILLRAPHLGSLQEACSPGVKIGRGDVFATLQLLDDLVPLRAEEDLEVVSSLLPLGSLAEYDAPILQARRAPTSPGG